MELFESKLDEILRVKTNEVNALLEIKAEQKAERAEIKKNASADIDVDAHATTSTEKPKRTRKKKEIV
jgi:hypothetical protein